jgi:myb proto-oncogene protein
VKDPRAHWTVEEDEKLTSAVTNTRKKKCGKEYRTDWVTVAALLPGRTKFQCKGRWHNALKPSIALTAGRTGQWTEDEDSKLEDAVQTHGGKDWVAISLLVPGRTKKECNQRWHSVMNPSITLAAGRTGKWTAVEEGKPKDAVQTHGDKDWAAIATLVPGRTKIQCCNRWDYVLDANIDRANGRAGKWADDEDSKLRDAVERHGGKDWGAISVLVPGRTKKQCLSRWHDVLDPSIGRADGRTGKWTAVEDSKLKEAVETHGDKDWVAIFALVPGRTKKQCCNRWHDVLDPNIDRTPPGRTGKWAENEVIKLKDAVRTNGGKNWRAIAALIPGRVESQCLSRWQSLQRSPKQE